MADLALGASWAVFGLLIALFIRMAFDLFAIRKMLEARGGDSGVRCPHCRFPVPSEATVCGHCSRDLTGVDAP